MAKNTWVSNFGQSVKFASVSAARDMNPALTRLYDNNAEYLKNISSLLGGIFTGQTKIVEGLERISPGAANFADTMQKAAKEGIARTKHGIKTGQFVDNPEAPTSFKTEGETSWDENAFSDFDAGEDFNFDDLNNLPDPEELMKGGYSEPSQEVEVAAKIGTAEINAINANTKAQVAASKATAASIANVGSAVAGQTKLVAKGFEATIHNAIQMNGALIASMQMASQKTNDTLVMINDNLANIINFNQDTQLKFAMAAMKYYDDSLEELKKISEGMLRISPIRGENKLPESDWDKVNMGFSLESYLDIVKQNAKNVAGLGEILQVLENPEMIAQIVANPMEFVMNQAIQQGIPALVKSTMNELNRSVENFFPALFAKLGGYAFDTEANPVLQMLGKLFGIQTPFSELNLGDYEKGAVPFDGITHKTINQVIPTYLSKILAVLTGGEERMFNYQTGMWESMSDIRRRQEYVDRNNRNIAFGNLGYALDDSVEDVVFETEDQRRKFIDAIEEFKKAAIDQRKFINWNNDDQIHEIMRDVMVEGMSEGMREAMGEWIAGVAREKRKSDQMEAANAAFNYHSKRRRDINNAFRNYDYGYIHLNSGFDDYVTADDIQYSNAMRARAAEQMGTDLNGDWLRDDRPQVINYYYGTPPPPGGNPPSGGGPAGPRSGSGGSGTSPRQESPIDYEDLGDRLGSSYMEDDDGMYEEEKDYSYWSGHKTGTRLKYAEDQEERIRSAKGKFLDDYRERALKQGLPAFEDFIMYGGRRPDIRRMRDEALEEYRLQNQDIKDAYPDELFGLNKDEDYDVFEEEEDEEKARERRRRKTPFEEYHNRIRDKQGPTGILASAINTVNETLYRVLFGSSDDEDSVIMILVDNIRETFGKLKKFLVDDVYSPLKRFLFGEEFTDSKVYKFFAGMFDKAGEYAVGKQDDDGYWSGGFMSEMANEFTDASKSIMYQITGKAYKDSKGVQHAENKESVMGEAGAAVKEAGNTLKTYLLGDNSEEEAKKAAELEQWRKDFANTVNGTAEVKNKAADVATKLKSSLSSMMSGDGNEELADNKALGGGIEKSGLYLLSEGEEILGHYAAGKRRRRKVAKTGLYQLKEGEEVVPAGGPDEIEESQAAEANFAYKLISKQHGELTDKLDEVVAAVSGREKPAKPLTEAEIKKRTEYTDAAVDKIGVLVDKIMSIENVNGEKKPFVDVVFDKVANSLANFAGALGGSRHFDDQFINKEYANAIRKKAPKAIARGLIGGGALALAGAAGAVAGAPFGSFGLLSFLLPGGPIGAMITGLGLSILHHNDTFLDAMYGKKDENGERQGGYVPKKIQDFVSKNKTGLLGGALMGTIYGFTGFSLPGTVLGMFGLGAGAGALSTLGMGLMGPVLFGSAMGLAVKSKAFRETLFGEEDPSDPTGKKKIGGLLNSAAAKKVKQLLPNTLVGAGLGWGALTFGSELGLLGSFAAPTLLGPIVGGAIGLGMATDRFKDAMFGKFDEKAGKFVSGGLVDTMKKVLEVEIAKPVSVFAQKSFAKAEYWFQKDILYPIAKAVLPMKALAGELFDTVKEKVSAVLTGAGNAVGSLLHKIVSPFQWLFRKVWDTTWGVTKTFLNTTFGIAGTLLSVPFKAIGVGGDMLRLRAKWKGSKYYDAMEDARQRAKDRKLEAEYKYKDRMEDLNQQEKDYKADRKLYRKTGYALTQEELDAKTAQYYDEQELMRQRQEEVFIKEEADRKEAQKTRVEIKDLLENLNATISFDENGSYNIIDKNSGLEVHENLRKMSLDTEKRLDFINQKIDAESGKVVANTPKRVKTAPVPKFKKFTPPTKVTTGAKITDQTADKLPATASKPSQLKVSVPQPTMDVSGMSTTDQLLVGADTKQAAMIDILGQLYSMMDAKLSQLNDFNLAQAALLKQQNSVKWVKEFSTGLARQIGTFAAGKLGAKLKSFVSNSALYGDEINEKDLELNQLNDENVRRFDRSALAGLSWRDKLAYLRGAGSDWWNSDTQDKWLRARRSARMSIFDLANAIPSKLQHENDDGTVRAGRLSDWFSRSELDDIIDQIRNGDNPPPDGHAAMGGGIPEDGLYLLSEGEEVLGNYAKGTRRRRKLIKATKLYRLKKGDQVIPAGGPDKVEESQAAEANFMFKVLNSTYGSLSEENEEQTDVMTEMRDLLKESLEHLESLDEELEENKAKMAAGAENITNLKNRFRSPSLFFGESEIEQDDNQSGPLKDRDKKTSRIFGGRTAQAIVKEREEQSYRQAILDRLSALRGGQQKNEKKEEEKKGFFDTISDLLGKIGPVLGIIGGALTATGIYALFKRFYDKFFGGPDGGGDDGDFGYHESQLLEDIIKTGGPSRAMKAVGFAARGVYKAGKWVAEKGVMPAAKWAGGKAVSAGGWAADKAVKGASWASDFVKDKARYVGSRVAGRYILPAMDWVADSRAGRAVSGAIEGARDIASGTIEGLRDFGRNTISAGREAASDLVENGAQKVKGLTDALPDEAKGLLDKIKTGIDNFIGALSKDGTIAKYIGNKMGALTEKFASLKSAIKLEDVKKFLPNIVKKIGESGAMAGIRTAAGTATAGLASAIFAGVDSIRGWTDASEIFEVSAENVTPGMKTAASLVQVILGLPYVVFVDLAMEIAYSLTGLNIKKQIAKFVYECLPGATEDIDKLQQQTIAEYEQWKKDPENADKNMQSFLNEKDKAYNPIKDTIREYVPGGTLLVGTQDEKGNYKDYGVTGAFSSAWEDTSMAAILATGGLAVGAKGIKRMLVGNDDEKGHHAGLIEQITGKGRELEHKLLANYKEDSLEYKSLLLSKIGLDPTVWDKETVKAWDPDSGVLPGGEEMTGDQRNAIATNRGRSGIELLKQDLDKLGENFDFSADSSIDSKSALLTMLGIDPGTYSEEELTAWDPSSGNLPDNSEMTDKTREQLKEIRELHGKKLSELLNMFTNESAGSFSVSDYLSNMIFGKNWEDEKEELWTGFKTELKESFSNTIAWFFGIDKERADRFTDKVGDKINSALDALQNEWDWLGSIKDGILVAIFGEEDYVTFDEEGNAIEVKGKHSLFDEYIIEPLFGKSASDFVESAGNLWDNLKANMSQEFRYRWRQMTDWLFGDNPDDEPVERPDWGNLFGGKEDLGNAIESEVLESTQAAVGEIVGEPGEIKEMKEESGGNMLDRLSSGVAHMFGGTDPVSGEEIDFFDSYVWKYWYGLPGTMADVISNFIGIGLGEDIDDVTEENKSLIERGFDGIQFLIGGENPYSGTYVDPKDSYLFEPAVGAYKEFKNTLAWFFGEEDTEDYKGKDSLIKRKLKEAWGWAEEKIKSGVDDLGKGADAFAKEANELILAGFDFFLGERLEPDKPPGLSKRGPGLIDRTMKKASDGWTDTMVYVFGDPEQGIDSQMLKDAKTSLNELKDSFWKPIEQWGIDRYNDIAAFGENLSEKFNSFKDMANKQIEEKGVIGGTFGIVANLFRGLLGLEWDTDPIQKTIDEAMESIKSGFGKLGEVGTNILKFGGIIVDTVSGMITSPVKLAGKIFDYFMGDDLDKDIDSAKKKTGAAKKSFTGFFEEVSKAGGSVGYAPQGGNTEKDNYLQTDGRWKGKPLVPGISGYGTVGEDGCGVTSLATAYRGMGYNITPDDLLKYVNTSNVAHNGTRGVIPSFFPQAVNSMGGKYIPINPNDKRTIAYFASKNIPIIGGGISDNDEEFSRSGHYSTFQGGYFKNGRFYMNTKDPLGRNVDVDINKLTSDVKAGGPSMLGAVIPNLKDFRNKIAHHNKISNYLAKVRRFAAGLNGGEGFGGGGEGDTWVYQTSAGSAEGAKPETMAALEDLGAWFKQRTGQPLVVTAITNGDHAAGERGHAAGWKIDLNDYGGGTEYHEYLTTDSNQRGSLANEFEAYGNSLGLGMNFEGAGTNNVHFDISALGDQWLPNANGETGNMGGYKNPSGRSLESGGTPSGAAATAANAVGSITNNPLAKFGAILTGMAGEYLTSLGQDKVGNYDPDRFLQSSTSGALSGLLGGSDVSADISGENEKDIWNYLAKVGFTPSENAGIMGNLAAESGLDPKRVQGAGHQTAPEITVDGRTGYGLAQWTYSTRQQGLKDYAVSVGKSSGDLGAQLEYLWKEAQNSGVIEAMHAGNQDPRTQADIWCDIFEKPDAEYAHKDQRRANAEMYFDKFGRGGGGMASRIAKWGLAKLLPEGVIKTITNTMDDYPALVAIAEFLDELSPAALYDMYEHTVNIQNAVDSGRMSAEEVASIYGNNQFRDVDWDTLGYSGGGGLGEKPTVGNWKASYPDALNYAHAIMLYNQGMANDDWVAKRNAKISLERRKYGPISSSDIPYITIPGGIMSPGQRTIPTTPTQQTKPKKKSFWARLGEIFGIHTPEKDDVKDVPILNSKTSSTGGVTNKITENSEVVVKRPGKPEDFGLDKVDLYHNPEVIAEVSSKLNLEFDDLGNVKGLTKVPDYNLIKPGDSDLTRYAKQRAQIQHFVEYGGTLPEVVDEEATAKARADANKKLKENVKKIDEKAKEELKEATDKFGRSQISDDANNPIAVMAKKLGIEFDGFGNVIGMNIPEDIRILPTDDDVTKYKKQAKQVELYSDMKKKKGSTANASSTNAQTNNQIQANDNSLGPIKTEQWTGSGSGIGLTALIDAVKANDIHAELNEMIKYMKAMVDGQNALAKSYDEQQKSLTKVVNNTTVNNNTTTAETGNGSGRRLPSLPSFGGGNSLKTNPNNAVSYSTVHAKNIEIARGGEFRSA